MGLFDLVREEQEAKKKAEESAKKDTKDAVVEEVEKVEEAPKEADQQPAPVAKAEKQAVEQATEIAEESKKEEKPAGKKTPKKKSSSEKTYKYPFGVYSEGRLIDVSSYGFADGQEYTEKEITDIMLQHRHYEFAGTMEYSYIEDDNVLVVTEKQHRKG
jgi:type IV secretory pathway VirB10-like protein